ncbi:type II toxin-antitoxin system RelE/ParE family toxin [Chloroflexota bacterium]
MAWKVEFYSDNQGNIPVQDFIFHQSAKVQAKFIHFIDVLSDFGLSLGQPYIKKLRDSDVWELRIRHSSNYYRVLYFATSGQRFVLLHVFLKKERKRLGVR